MRIARSPRVLGPVLVFIAMVIGPISGCGEDSTKTGDAALSAEGKKVSEGVQGGMKEFMQTKGKTKPQGR